MAKHKKKLQREHFRQMKQILNFVNAHSDVNPPAAPLYYVEFAQPKEKMGS